MAVVSQGARRGETAGHALHNFVPRLRCTSPENTLVVVTEEKRNGSSSTISFVFYISYRVSD